MIKRPVKYEPREDLIVDADFKPVVAMMYPMGVTNEEADARGFEIAAAINELDTKKYDAKVAKEKEDYMAQLKKENEAAEKKRLEDEKKANAVVGKPQ